MEPGDSPAFSLCSRCWTLLKNVWGSPPVKEDAHMEQFLLDVAAQVVASVIVALFVYLMKRR